jgi:hypothetical protein
MVAILLTLFCYLGWALYGIVLWFATGSAKAPGGQGPHLWRIAGVSVAFGALVGVIATLTAANPPEGPGVSFVGNGILGFPQLIFLSLVAGMIIVGVRQALWGFLIVPVMLIASFALTWWGLSHFIPPQPPNFG